MNSIEEELISLEVISEYDYDLLKVKYGDEAIIDALRNICLVYENKYLEKNTIDFDELYEIQLKLWNKYGYCFSVLHYYPFYSILCDRYKDYDMVNNGFKLLYFNYVKVVDDKRNLKIDEIIDSLERDSEKVYVYSYVKDYFDKYSPESNFDKNLYSYVLDKNLNGVIDNNVDNIFIRQLKMYFDYKSSLRWFTHSNYSVIENVASNYIPNYQFKFDDFVSYGYFGLDRACKSYDIRRGCSFSSYAYNWVWEAIHDAYKKYFHFVYFPNNRLIDYHKIGNYYYDSFRDNGSYPSYEEYATMLGCNVSRVRKLQMDLGLYNPESFQQSIILDDEDDDEYTLEDITASSCDSIEDNYVKMDTMEIIYDVMREVLTDREREILCLRNGFYNERVYTFEEIGKMFGFSHQYAQQIVRDSLNKLRKRRIVRSLNPFK